MKKWILIMAFFLIAGEAFALPSDTPLEEELNLTALVIGILCALAFCLTFLPKWWWGKGWLQGFIGFWIWLSIAEITVALAAFADSFEILWAFAVGVPILFFYVIFVDY